MNNVIPAPTLAPPEFHQPPPRNKWEREYRAFRLLLPELLLAERDNFVAVHEGRVIDRDRDEMALIARVLARIGNVDIHVGHVAERLEPVYRSGLVRDLSPSELDTFQLVLDHGQLQKVLDNFPGTDLDAAQNIINLMKREFVVVP